MKDANVTPVLILMCSMYVKLNVQDILYNLYDKYMVYFYVNAFCWPCVLCVSLLNQKTAVWMGVADPGSVRLASAVDAGLPVSHSPADTDK